MSGWRKRVPRAKRRRSGYRASQTDMTIEHLMIEAAALKRLIDATPPGMPRLSGTGPPGTVCGQCSFYGYGTQYANSCYRYFLLTSQHGEPFPISTPSCQLFLPRNMGPCLEQLPRFPCRPDKHPLVAGGFNAATTDPAQIAIWQAQFPNCLWGVPTGAVSGIDVLDIDPEGLGWFAANRDRIPVTRVHRTPRGGLHLFFKHAPGLRCSRGRIAPGVDVRADGGYVIWWPQ